MVVRSLSRTEAKVVLSLEESGREEISIHEIRARAGVSPGYARKLAHDLAKKRWLVRVGGGRYLLNPSRHGPEAVPETDPLRLGSRLASPYYFGFATAAELEGLLPQASRVYYVVTPRRGPSLRTRVAEFRRITVAPRRFFGTRKLVRRGEAVTVSDIERTVLDCLSRPELSGGLGGVVQIAASAAGRLDWYRLHRYLVRLGSRSLALRLGFLFEWLELGDRPPKGWLDRLRARPGEPYVPLGHPREFGRRGRHDRRWHVVLNVPEPLLRAEVDVR